MKINKWVFNTIVKKQTYKRRQCIDSRNNQQIMREQVQKRKSLSEVWSTTYESDRYQEPQTKLKYNTKYMMWEKMG